MVTKNFRGTVTIDESAKEYFLSLFGKSIDKDGCIIEKDTGQKVITPDGQELTLKEFSGMRKGSEIFIRSDLPSIVELVNKFN